MTKCPSCSAEMLESNRFCGACGSVLTPASNGDETMAMAAPSSSSPRTSASFKSASSDSPDEGRFLPGTLVAERYRILGLLGRGGMGEVYRATDLRLSQQVALKFLPESTASDPDILARFHNEVRIARQVSHPNVCRVYDIGEVDGQPYISMEYVDGENLSALLRRIGRLPNDTALEMARKLCAGLAAAHDKGVLHRDLKPANIMIDGRGQVLVTDFGLAGIASQIHGAEIKHGTPAYMAPEQLAGTEVTVRSDVYALGLVLYEMFSGKRAFEANSLAEMTRLRNETGPPSLVSQVRDLDPGVERVIRRCLETDPQNRPASALAVAAALPGGDPLAAALAAGETPSPELVARATDREALRPMIALAVLAGIVACVAAIPFLRSQTAWISKTPLENSPDALAQKARETLRAFGYQEKPFDSAYGMHYAADYLADLDQRDGKARSTLGHLNAGQPAPILFWYRTSPRYMLAGNFGNDGEVQPDDPAMDVSGMVQLELDPQGHLVSFAAVPPQVDKSRSTTQPLDGNALLTAAGLDPARFKTAEPQWTPPASSDQRAAWTGTYPNDPNPLRVEAASWRGKLVYFALISPWTRADRMQPAEQTLNQKVLLVVILSLLCMIVIAAGLLARHNVRAGRADWRNAFRLSGFLFALSMASWAFGTHYMASAGELLIVMMGLSINLLAALLIWVLYVALEPYVRRRWPQTIISWTRVLNGRMRDPVVGGHMLAGIFFGVFSALATDVTSFVNMHSSGVPAPTVKLGSMMGATHVAGALLGMLPNSILNTLGIFFLLFVFRLIFRKEWLTAIIFVLFFAALGSLAHAEVALITLPVRLLQLSLMLYVMLRCGLFAYVVGAAVASVLMLFPITSDFSAWYAGSAIFTLICILALTGYAFHTALGGRPLFKAGFLEE
jgi:serine/threonine protein kinase